MKQRFYRVINGEDKREWWGYATSIDDACRLAGWHFGICKVQCYPCDTYDELNKVINKEAAALVDSWRSKGVPDGK